MPTVPHPDPLHHYHEATRVLATIGSLGVVEEEAQREALTALCHAVLALTAAVIGSRT